MGLIRDDTGRLHIDTPLMAESLMDKALLDRTDVGPVFRPLPDLNVVKLGGQSVIDRGSHTLLPLLDEIVAARAAHPILVMTGGGTRSRHAYAIALDLGMPTGVLAKLGASISEQNALMISILLAPHGGIKIGHDDMVKLPAYLALGSIPVMHAMPPYGLWEEPPRAGPHPGPSHRRRRLLDRRGAWRGALHPGQGRARAVHRRSEEGSGGPLYRRDRGQRPAGARPGRPGRGAGHAPGAGPLPQRARGAPGQWPRAGQPDQGARRRESGNPDLSPIIRIRNSWNQKSCRRCSAPPRR